MKDRIYKEGSLLKSNHIPLMSALHGTTRRCSVSHNAISNLMEEWAENAHQFVRITAPKDDIKQLAYWIRLDKDNLREAEDSLSN